MRCAGSSPKTWSAAIPAIPATAATLAILAIPALLATMLCGCVRMGFGTEHDYGRGREARQDDALLSSAANDPLLASGDASSGDALRLEAGRTRDRGLDPSPVTDCSSRFPNTLLCDSFEAPLPGQADYSDLSAGSLLERTTSSAYRGSSLRAKVAAASHAFLGKQLSPVTGGELHLRAFVLVRPGADIGAGWVVLLAVDAAGMWPKISVDLVGGDRLQIANNVGTTFFQTAPGGLIRDRWTCLELRIKVSSTAGELELSVDGKSVLKSSASQVTLPSGGFSSFRFGILPDLPVPVELLMDDVVLDTKPIPCP